MDSIDDFEFKPITEGLGFHKKPQAGKQAPAKTFVADKFVSEKIVEKKLPSHTMKRNQTYFEPQLSSDVNESLGSAVIGSERSVVIDPVPPKSAPTQRQAPRTEVSKPVQTKNRIENVVVTPSASQKLTPVVVPAIIFDAIMVLGLSCLFSFVVLVVAQLDPLIILKMSVSDPMTMIAVAVLVFSVQQLYSIVSRSFFGGTMGEWAFETELGTQNQQASAFYPVQVLARSLLISITGYVTIPLLSLILNKDLAGNITGLKLYRH